MWERVETLRTIGHPVDKLEVLVLGGTWESYPADYQEWYIKHLFYAANMFFDAVPNGFKGGAAGHDGVEEYARHAMSLAKAVRPVGTLDEEQTMNESTFVGGVGGERGGEGGRRDG